VSDDGTSSPNWPSTTKVGTVAGGGLLAVLLVFWNIYQDTEAASRRDQRNQQQLAICTSVNRVVNMNGIILRESLQPRADQTPDQRDRIDRLRTIALTELDKARCEVTPVD
jgi:hypothetical protein